MATNDAGQAFAGELGVDEERIVDELIWNQAEGLVDAIRELIQNGVDAPGSTEIRVSITPEKTVVEDDGDGMELTDIKVRQFLTTLGLTTKQDDPEAIGMFGIGFAQALAKGRVTAQSGQSVVEFDAKEWGRKYKLYDGNSEVDGFRVEITHYEDDVPDPDSSEWDAYADDVGERFQFMELIHDVEVTVNGSLVSDETPEEMMTETDVVYQDDLVYIALRQTEWSDWIKVYSAGLKVTSNRGYGLRGYVITKQNLELNTARNSIQESCELWPRVEAKLDGAKAEVLIQQDSLTKSARKSAAKLLGKGYDTFADKAIFKDGDGGYVSYEDIQACDDMIWTSKGSPWGGKLATRGEMALLEDDAACRELNRVAQRSDAVKLPDAKDEKATARALGLFNGYEEMDDETAQEEMSTKRIAMARILAHKMGIDREIRYGKDDQCRAWTDGEDVIYVTVDAWTKKYWEGWVFQLWRVLAHEASHDESSEGQPDHGDAFCRNFRDLVDDHEPAYLEVVEEIREGGVNATVRRYEHIHGLEV